MKIFKTLLCISIFAFLSINTKAQVCEYDRSWQGNLNKTSTDWWQGGSSTTPNNGFY